MKWLIPLMLMIAPAHATIDPASMTCKEIRAGIITVGGIANAEALAKRMGLSQETIDKGRRCLVKRRPNSH